MNIEPDSFSKDMNPPIYSISIPYDDYIPCHEEILNEYRKLENPELEQMHSVYSYLKKSGRVPLTNGWLIEKFTLSESTTDIKIYGLIQDVWKREYDKCQKSRIDIASFFRALAEYTSNILLWQVKDGPNKKAECILRTLYYSFPLFIDVFKEVDGGMGLDLIREIYSSILDVPDKALISQEYAKIDESLKHIFAKKIIHHYCQFIGYVQDSDTTEYKKIFFRIIKQLIDDGENVIRYYYQNEKFTTESAVFIKGIISIIQNNASLIEQNNNESENTNDNENMEENDRLFITADDLELFIINNDSYRHFDELENFHLDETMRDFDRFVLWSALNIPIKYEDELGYNAYLYLMLISSIEELYVLKEKGVFPGNSLRYLAEDLAIKGGINKCPLLLLWIQKEGDGFACKNI